MIKTLRKNIHWDYYIALECDLAAISRFIEFSEDNFNTYSIELAHLLLAASSEVDVVIKKLCNLVSPKLPANNINDYRNIIKISAPELVNTKVVSKRYALHLSPWENWKQDKNPVWWGSYNKVKHERNNHFHEANLKNSLNAVAALLVANIFLNYQVIFYEANERCDPLIGRIGVERSSAIRYLDPVSSLFRIDDIFLYASE